MEIIYVTIVTIITTFLTVIFSKGLLYIPYFNSFFPYNMIGIFFLAIIFRKKILFFNYRIIEFSQIILTILAHYSGLSVGREGVAIKVGYYVGKKWGEKYNLELKNKDLLKSVGMAAGFSTLFQTPITAFLFATEKKNINYIIYNIYSSYLAYIISKLFNLHKFKVNIIKINIYENLIYVLLFSVCMSAISLIYIYLKKNIKKLSKYNYLYFIFIILIIIFIYITNGRYQSLGTNLIDISFKNSESILKCDFIFKLLITALCVGVGFFGGEVTPLFSIGSCFGVIFSNYFGLNIYFYASLGYILMFSGCTKTKYSPILMSIEIFSKINLPIYILSVLLVDIIKGKYSIYENDEFD